MAAAPLHIIGEPHDPLAGMTFKAEGKRGEILIYDRIGADWLDEGVTANAFARELKALGKLDVLNVRINSPGGNVFDGLAIYNTLKANGARIEVDVDGAALSIASVIAMAGDEIRMADNALMMLHLPSAAVRGNAGDLRTMAETLDKMTDSFARTYADRARQTPANMRAYMEAETWFDAQEAVAAGLADRVIRGQRIAANVGDDWRDHVPQRFQDRLEINPPRPAATIKEPVMADTNVGTPAPEKQPADVDLNAERLAALKARYGSDPAFVLDAFEQRWSMADAENVWLRRQNERQAAELAEARAALETLKAEVAKSAASPPAPSAGAQPVAFVAGSAADASAPDFMALARRRAEQKNIPVHQAMSQIAQEQPDAYAAYRDAQRTSPPRKVQRQVG